VERDLGEEGEKRGDLVRNHLGGMVVTVVHQRNAAVFVSCRVAERELSRADGVRLNADTEYLGLNAGLYLVKIKGLG
jgi:hypothetical protein